MVQRESSKVEFKRECSDTIRRSVIAFANSDGGCIYVGIADDGEVYGVADVDVALSRIANTIRDSILPDVTLFTRCDPEIMDGKKVIRIDVQRGTARPYYWKEKGIRPEGVFVRQGASSVPASPAAILQMIGESGEGRYEDARSFNQDLTFTQTAAFFRKKGLAFGKAQMQTLHFIGNDCMYSNLAWMLSDQCVHSIKLAVFEGVAKSVFRDRRELSGSLLKQIEDAFEFIDRLNRTRSDFQGLDRVDSRDYPPEAIREGLLNLVVHRDYSFAAASLISLFEDRLEMISVGGLLPGIQLSDYSGPRKLAKAIRLKNFILSPTTDCLSPDRGVAVLAAIILGAPPSRRHLLLAAALGRGLTSHVSRLMAWTVGTFGIVGNDAVDTRD
ncbi:MAG: putative DNA binding domain-containing protein [Lentisphaeria bacterium]|nr:putative DNA binding domain-containing protein [Lentisphaeria bacterium]